MIHIRLLMLSQQSRRLRQRPPVYAMPALQTTRASFSPYHPVSWVPHFRALTTKTRFISLEAPLLESILSNTLTLPTPASDVEWSDGTTTPASPPPAPTEGADALVSAINAAIAELGGFVSPKLGMRAPVDATWCNFYRTTKCCSAEDVLTLVAASERVTRDAESSENVLVIRQWADLDARMEFRVFVRDEVPIAVSPRSEIAVEYAEADMDAIVERILHRHRSEVSRRWRGPDSYVMDVYIDRENVVWIVDFDEWGAADALLFEWQELEAAQWPRAQFRCAVSQGVHASERVFDGLPLELRNPGAMRDLVEAARRLTVEEVRSDSDEDTDGDELAF